MPIVPKTVSDVYDYVVGVDTHAATHSLVIISAKTGAVIDHVTFPTTAAGLHRAVNWIGVRSEGDRDAVLVTVEGTRAYGAVLCDGLSGFGYRVVEAPTSRRGRGDAKTDQVDALVAARATLGLVADRLRDPRAGLARAALAVLTAARDQLNTERLRAINALIALVRTYELGIDSRRALSREQITRIASWRCRDEPLGTATARREAARLAKRIHALDTELAENHQQLAEIVTVEAPELLELPGVGAVTAAIVFTVWSHPGRIHSEAAFARIAGTCPIPASSGNTQRHRLNRGGDRKLNRAINTVVLTRMRIDPDTHAYIERRTAEGKTTKEIRRCLRRYVTREVYRTLNSTHPGT